MSDNDRLTDYAARMDNPDHMRDLADGCANCGHSHVFCRCCRYMDLGTCCSVCTH